MNTAKVTERPVLASASSSQSSAYGLTQLSETLVILAGKAAEIPPDGGESWDDGSGGSYMEVPVPAWACPDMDICVKDGRAFIHVKS